MPRISRLVGLTGFVFSAAAVPAGAQAVLAGPRPHMVVVQLVLRNDPAHPFAFEPGVVQLQRGDTVRFVEAANVLHNVRFVTEAPGSKLGAAAVSPYLTRPGESYTLAIDSRFAAGKYEYICEPHQMLGMKGTLIVSDR